MTTETKSNGDIQQWRTAPPEGTNPEVTKTPSIAAQSRHDLAAIDRWWRAANYLSVGQIYLLKNALLREPLQHAHVKPRLVGHWGTTPGLNFIYAHMNRAIVEKDLSVIFLAGPGHGGPALVANAWLEGTYSDVYPNVSLDEEGMTKLFRQFSFPGGIPSHAAPETPGSIHEGGELGYVLAHAFGAVFDNPDLIALAVVGDGEAETGPLATSWHGNKFLNPIRDGAVLPVLHLNGYKIANPAMLARIPPDELDQLLRGYGWDPHYVEGDDPANMHHRMADVVDICIESIQLTQQDARANGFIDRPCWPMIVSANGRRPHRRRVVALPPGSTRESRLRRTPGDARRMAAELQTRRALRQARSPAHFYYCDFSTR
jgi:xylulose-5-phosphate/fructose-6-phosphate phosphoketolase